MANEKNLKTLNHDEAVNKQNLKAIIKLFDALRVADGFMW